mgnify:CR=1 FL=1
MCGLTSEKVVAVLAGSCIMITSTRGRETVMNASHVIGLLFLAMALATLFSREPLAAIPVAAIGILLMFGNTKRPV